MSLLSLVSLAIGQVTKSVDSSEIVSATPQADSPAIPRSPGASSQESKSPSSDTESNTNGVLPTDPSMIPPPESAPAENTNSVPLPVDPNAGNTTEASVEETSPVNNTESIEKKKHEIKVRYNEVRTQVEKEESVAALHQAADKATTAEGQRQTLKAYYELLFKRMKQVDPSLTERCDLMQGAYLRRIDQNGFEPTIPLNLPSKNEVQSTNPPTPPLKKGKLHKKTSTFNSAP